MPRRRHTQPQMSEARLEELLLDYKPEIKVDQEWLKSQRLMLMGAIEVAEEGGLFSNIWDNIVGWWDDQPYGRGGDGDLDGRLGPRIAVDLDRNAHP